MTDKLYQIIPGGDLSSSQLTALMEEIHTEPIEFFTARSWYFHADGEKFLGVWRKP